MHDARVSLLWLGCVALIAGCSSRPDRIRPVDVDPSSAASSAIEMYDKDGDSAIGGNELAAVPGIKNHIANYDKDGDGKVSRDEIATRLQSWTDARMGILGSTLAIKLDGQWLGGATVTFVPEPYLGENVHPATGVTMENGFVTMSHADEFLPKSNSGRLMHGVTNGTFKIQITHPTRKVPARYNTATELGEEIAADINPTGSPIQISLTSK